MIKVQNDITKDTKNPLAVVLRNRIVKEYLRDMGVDLGRHAHPDFTFTMANGLKDVKPNTIAFERIDGAQIKNKHLLRNANLLKLVKMSKFRDTGTNNLSSVDGRAFTRYLEDEEFFEPVKMFIHREEFQKVVLGVNFLHYKRHEKCERKARELDKHTDKDVFFAGSTKSYGSDKGHKSGQLVAAHRTSCVEALNAIDCNKLVADSREFGADSYLDHLANAKVTVSPWGWGESCYRDYEALMLQTDVIKPKGYAIETLPDIYRTSVFYCRTHWSNLETVINYCLETWAERADKRKATAENLIEWRQPETIAKILRGLI